MSHIKILDCTLRDGGYINNFKFGQSSIHNILEKLAEAKVDIIECGFLSDKGGDVETSVFDSVEGIETAIGNKKPGVMYVAMIALGEKEISHEKISPNNGRTIDGIRITFHEYEIERAFEYAEALRAKGYEPFLQPIGTTSYTDKALIELIEKTNRLKPFAFYLVDTLGTMYSQDVLRLFHLVNHNLDPKIAIGFHSHNNLQLSFANTQALMLLHTKRKLLIDSSVFGMGRGAGNLCTELITQYINDNIGETYKILPLLEIAENYLMSIHVKNSWGYSIPYYLAAVNNCHPNYTSYLLNKQTITVPTIKILLQLIPPEQRVLFSKDIIERIYLNYQSNSISDKAVLFELEKIISHRKVLLIAPGKTLKTERTKIVDFIQKEKPIIISVNFQPDCFDVDFVFISNAKRCEYFKDIHTLDAIDLTKLIVSSNLCDQLPRNTGIRIVNYQSLLHDMEDVRDNAGLMATNLMIKTKCHSLYLAGFDGFVPFSNDNYSEKEMNRYLSLKTINRLTENMKLAISQIQLQLPISFVTTSQYEE